MNGRVNMSSDAATEVVQRNPLSEEESRRLDGLLAAARSFHYAALSACALIALLTFSPDRDSMVQVPLYDVKLPALHAGVAVFLVVCLLSMAADKMFRLAFPFLEMDNRRPPFAWIALGKKPNYFAVTVWLILPSFMSGGLVATLASGDHVGIGLAVASPYLFLTPRALSHNFRFAAAKQDERGGPATLSIFLLNWYRVARSLLVVSYLFLPMLAIVPEWRSLVTQIGAAALGLWCGLYALRLLGSIQIVYRFVDRMGSMMGFPAESHHYR